jgi:hypothetical protein
MTFQIVETFSSDLPAAEIDQAEINAAVAAALREFFSLEALLKKMSSPARSKLRSRGPSIYPGPPDPGWYSESDKIKPGLWAICDNPYNIVNRKTGVFPT